MPTYSSPRNDNQRLAFLKRAAAAAAQDIAAGNPYISPELLDRLESFVPGYQETMSIIGTRLSARARAVRERAAAMQRVETYTRDFWESIRRQVRRLDLPAEVLSFYRLPMDGLTPTPNTQEEWLSLAAQVVRGDGEAAAAGYPPAVGPSAAELQAVLETAHAQDEEMARAERAYHQAQQATAALRPAADELITDVVAELRFNLRKLDPPGQRRIMRTYGARFRRREGEAVPAEDGGDWSAIEGATTLTESPSQPQPAGEEAALVMPAARAGGGNGGPA